MRLSNPYLNQVQTSFPLLSAPIRARVCLQLIKKTPRVIGNFENCRSAASIRLVKSDFSFSPTIANVKSRTRGRAKLTVHTRVSNYRQFNFAAAVYRVVQPLILVNKNSRNFHRLNDKRERFIERSRVNQKLTKPVAFIAMIHTAKRYAISRSKQAEASKRYSDESKRPETAPRVIIDWPCVCVYNGPGLLLSWQRWLSYKNSNARPLLLRFF